MLGLQIYRHNELLLTLKTEKKFLKIGRSPDADVHLPDPTLSRTHCLLIQKDEQWYVEDSSKNGIYLDDSKEKISGRFRFENHQRLRLGRIFSFEISENKQETDQEKTLITSPRATQIVSVDSKGDRVLLGKASVSGVLPNEARAFKKVLEPQGLSIGSHDSNDICFATEEISRFHARIDFVQNEYILSDLGSTNGTHLNGVRILKASLPEKAEIRIGPFELKFQIENEEVKIQAKKTNSFFDMVSQDRKMKKIFSTVETVAGTEASVLIHGETGTGKELLARAIHTLSPRYQFPLVSINCAALPKELVESELFGHEKGAFTGAISQRIGAFEAAHFGTLFLDEIGELDLSLQAKLLRALETGEIRRVGSARPQQISVRIISATHRDLSKEVQAGKFREDLYYRLMIVPIELPPLRERMEDLDLLVSHLLRELKIDVALDPLVVDGLKTYSFPGNIRELKNILQRAFIEMEVSHSLSPHSKGKKILRPQHFGFMKGVRMTQNPMSAAQMAEREKIVTYLRKNSFNQSRTAQEMGVAISTLHDRIKKYGISIPGRL